MASEIKVDTISEKTSAGGVTIDGLLIKDGGISGDVSLIGTTPTFTIGDAGAEDAALVFDGNAQDFYIALDDSADDLVIGLGSTVGTTPAISINSDRDVTISDGAIDFDVASHDGSNGLKLAGTLVTTTAAEMNLLDGGTSVGSSITVADADGFIVNDGGTMKTIPATDIPTYVGGGVTMADSWRISTSFTSSGSDADITANWERVDTDGYGTIGSAMTESSGIFTFPSTGIYLILFQSHCTGASSATTYNGIVIETTTDNSTYSIASQSYDSSADQSDYSDMNCSFIFDVTNTSNDKVKFGVENNNEAVYNGNTGVTRTGVNFIRLGDT